MAPLRTRRSHLGIGIETTKGDAVSVTAPISLVVSNASCTPGVEIAERNAQRTRAIDLPPTRGAQMAEISATIARSSNRWA